VNELFSEGLHHGAAAIEEGDTNLVSEKAIKWITGTEIRKAKWQLDASAFLQYINDFIYLTPTGEPRLTIRGAFPVFQYVQDDVRLMGAEGALQFALAKHWQWRSEYAMVRARNISEDTHLIGIPSDRMKHTLLWKNANHTIDAELATEYVWEQVRVPENVDYTPPPDGYLLIHAGVGVDLIRDRLHLHATVRNLLNEAYREYLNRLRYYADDTGRSVELRLHYVF
jgi:iron complex outermembrane receptor protein